MGKPKHFGIYLSSVEEDCQSGIWQGISHFAKEQGISVTLFISTYQHKVGQLSSHYEVTRDFSIQAASLDGMLFLGGPIADGLGREKTMQYQNLFDNLPLLSISLEHGVNSINVDNRSGMKEIVSHLIEEHGASRIAFVRGPEEHPEAEERYLGYCEALRDANIPFDDALICPGTFSEQSGREAVEILLDKRHASIDAIAAVDDETAFGAIEALNQRNISVPEEIAITGFDDIEMASVSYPALSTVRQPFFDLGYRAASALFEQLITGHPSGHITLLSRPIYRQTCGCVPAEVTREYYSTDENLRDMRDTLALRLHDSAGVPLDIAKEWLTALYTYLPQLPEGERPFLQEFDRILARYRSYSDDLAIWQQLLSEFQSSANQITMHNPPRLAQVNALILKCSWLILEALRTKDQRAEFASSRHQWKIRGISYSIMSAFDTTDLYSRIEAGFRELGINRTLIALYNRPVAYNNGWNTPEELRIIIAFNRWRRLIPAEQYQKITIADLLEAEEALFGDDARTTFMLPLFFGKEQLGVILIEENRAMPVDMYEAMRLAVSSAIRSTLLFDEMQELAIKDEMTGLYNRRGFLTLAENRLNLLKRTAERAAILFLDLDGLKIINDTHGHAEGDHAIMETARILSQCTRKGDILARLGGDEFLLFASDLGSKGIDEIVHRVRRAFSHFNEEVSKLAYKLHCFIGAEEMVVTEATELDELVEKADALLYREKERKKRK